MRISPVNFPSMRLAVTHPYSWPEVRRGAERIIMETARSVAARGHEVTVFSAGDQAGSEELPDGFRMVRFARKHADPLKHERWFGRKVMPALVRGRFDAVHSMMPYDALAALAAKRLTRHRMVTLYDEMGIPQRWWWKSIPDGRTRRRIARSTDVYGCMSRCALDALRGEWGREGVLIPGGVRLSEFAPVEREPNPTVLFSGALDEPRKGLGTLLEAIAIVAEEEPDVVLWVSGAGDAGPILAKGPAAALERTTVLPLGAPEEQGGRYGRAWATSLPSEGDSFGLVLIESLASGTPIVAADDGAPPELVRPGIGAMTRLHDPESLADGLREAFALARHPATADACRAAASAYDWDQGLAPWLERLYSGEPPGPDPWPQPRAPAAA